MAICDDRWDFVIIGSGFGGSVSALRLSEKGYRVLVLEKGRRFRKEDFAASNWDIRRWLWQPEIRLRGIFQMTFLRHVTVLHGVGVGGGSLVYANTLPTPPPPFFAAPSWARLANWQKELEPHYQTARRMLGATPNPTVTPGDRVLGEVARDLGRGATTTRPRSRSSSASPGERFRIRTSMAKGQRVPAAPRAGRA
jgi:cholesterol oxidase